jgi:hypothetical protein
MRIPSSEGFQELLSPHVANSLCGHESSESMLRVFAAEVQEGVPLLGKSSLLQQRSLVAIYVQFMCRICQLLLRRLG